MNISRYLELKILKPKILNKSMSVYLSTLFVIQSRVRRFGQRNSQKQIEKTLKNYGIEQFHNTSTCFLRWIQVDSL
jgi:hypothetical protein